jgi:hypothetical protein
LPDHAAGVKKLRALQRAFATGIMRPLTKGQRMQPKWVDGSATSQAVGKFVKPNDRLSSLERIEIYNRQYWFRLIDSFYEDFPGLRTLIGDKRFYDLSVAYLTKYPSRSFTLRDLGDRLEKFVARQPEWIAPHAALARDIIRLEWAHIAAFDGEDLPPLEIDALLDGGDPATLRLGFQPHVTFLACAYPVDNFILAVRRREEPRGEASNAMDERVKPERTRKVPRPKPEKIWLAIHRSEHVVYYKRLEREAYLICSALQKGLSLQAACEKAFRGRRADDLGAKLQDWFAQWASFGWFCRVE